MFQIAYYFIDNAKLLIKDAFKLFKNGDLNSAADNHKNAIILLKEASRLFYRSYILEM